MLAAPQTKGFGPAHDGVRVVSPGHLVLVLHTHLPWVLGHGRWPHGQDWLHEAIAECYVPLLRMIDRMVEDGVSPQLTIGITPVLAEMLASPRLREDFAEYCEERTWRAEEDRKEFRRFHAGEISTLAAHWSEFYEFALDDFRRTYKSDILGALRRLQDEGHIEILTSAATHGYLPLLGTQANVSAQVRAGVATYRRHFGRAPKGIWLPECAYRPGGAWTGSGGRREGARPGLERVLAANGLAFFFVDTHLVAGGTPMGTYEDRIAGDMVAKRRKPTGQSPNEPHAVIAKGGKRLAVYARDPRSSTQVWSADYGFPGDGAYLEFHRKKGPQGLRYHRVTDRRTPLDAKEVYAPEAAAKRAAVHAEHFIGLVRGTLAAFHREHGRPGVVVAPFDTELFGHWWFEGPQWLEHVLRGLQEDVTPLTASAVLERHPPASAIRLPEGSWGLGGAHYVWNNDDTVWVWDVVYRAEDAFLQFVNAAKGKRRPELKRVAAQLARELLILESSDWPFLITTRSARDYAEARVKLHADAFDELLAVGKRVLEASLTKADEALLRELEMRDAPFPEIDLGWWTGD